MCSKRPLEGSYAQTWRMNRGTPGKKDVHRRFEVEEMAFVELSRQVEESRVLKIFRKVICTGIWYFWGSWLYSDMEEAIKRWIVGVSFKEFGLYMKGNKKSWNHSNQKLEHHSFVFKKLTEAKWLRTEPEGNIGI